VDAVNANSRTFGSITGSGDELIAIPYTYTVGAASTTTTTTSTSTTSTCACHVWTRHSWAGGG
jgi:hypothetical protein